MPQCLLSSPVCAIVIPWWCILALPFVLSFQAMLVLEPFLAVALFALLSEVQA